MSKPSATMRGVLRAMLDGVRYECEWWGVRVVSEFSAPRPTWATMEALERRGLVAYKHPHRDGGDRPRWELTDAGRQEAGR